jgi:hypothetical protein
MFSRFQSYPLGILPTKSANRSFCDVGPNFLTYSLLISGMGCQSGDKSHRKSSQHSETLIQRGAAYTIGYQND